MRIRLFAIALLLTAPFPAMGQAPPAQDHQHAPPSHSWSWTTDANVFFGYNYQHRKFRDFSAWESQNWFMLEGARRIGAGRLIVGGMASLEPFTIPALGSPQVFQTGESYQGGPLKDRQHPHDLIMQLGATYRLPHERVTYVFTADLVGPAALGPTPFMHRASARENPQAPLTHHYMDSTHITPGVIRAGIEAGGFTVEGSVFRGEEPDEHRLNLGRPWLDSWSVRGQWQRGPWRAQVSGGLLHHPSWFEPYDIPRLTASIEFDGTLGSRPLSATVAWGENREIHGVLDGYLAEWNAATSARGSLYGRAEAVAKDLLDLGAPDPPGFVSFHRISHLSALTLGYTHDVARHAWGRLGIGGDVTIYGVPDNMIEFYGAPRSFHVFLRYRPATSHRH